MIKELILSNGFLDLSLGAKTLYFYLFLSASDDTHITKRARACMYLTGTTEDDLRELVQIGLVEELSDDSGDMIVRTCNG